MESGNDRWQSRPIASMALRAAVFVVPVVLSATISIMIARTAVRATGMGGLMLRFLVAFAVSLVVLRVTDRASRRLLPLAVLWKMSLAFPSVAPSRWRLARQAGNVQALERIATEARENGIVDEPARAATQILSLVAAVEAHDRATRGHSERVRIYADLIAEELKLDDDNRNKLRWASLLHDVGKLMVPAKVLNKPARLDDEEFDLVAKHPEQGMRFIEPLRNWLGEWAYAVEQHHERYDGTGYPQGLEGSRISRAARIVSVADSYEVMTARRAYKRPMNATAARAELVKCAGSQFDPAIVRAFLEVSLGKLRLVAGPLAWLAQTPFLRGLESVASSAGVATTGGALVLGMVPVLPMVAPLVPRTAGAEVTSQAQGDEFSTQPPPSARPTPSASQMPQPSPQPSAEPSPQPSIDDPPPPDPSSTPKPTVTKTPPPTSRKPDPTESPIATPTKSPDPKTDDPKPTPTESPSPETSPTPFPTGIGRLPI